MVTIQKESNVIPASGKGLEEVEDTIYVRTAKLKSADRNKKKEITPFLVLCFHMPNAQNKMQDT